MIRIEAQDKYTDGNRDSETYFLETLYCARYQFCKETARKVNPTDRYELFCVICGEVYVPDAKKRIGKNGIILIQRLSQAELKIKENTVIVHIGFMTSIEFSILKFGNKLSFFENFSSFQSVNKLYRFTCLKSQAAGVKDALLLELLCDMNECAKVTHSEMGLYHRACDWIERNCAKAITAQDVASFLNCSRAHLNRVIKATSGECLGNLIARYRLERIKNLCDSGNVSISEIAQMLDFYSVELLCKFFKYHEGISISEYRSNKI